MKGVAVFGSYDDGFPVLSLCERCQTQGCYGARSDVGQGGKWSGANWYSAVYGR